MTLKRDHLTPGACISCDHFVSPTKARRVDGFGRNTHHSGYEGGAIYVDHASGKVFCHLQSSLDAADTIRGKQILEKDAQDCGHRVLKYHSDNGIFASAEFRDHCDKLNQDLSFSGVGAHHQNGVAERAIGTVCRLPAPILST
jgi:transposase InsO family protein